MPERPEGSGLMVDDEVGLLPVTDRQAPSVAARRYASSRQMI